MTSLRATEFQDMQGHEIRAILMNRQERYSTIEWALGSTQDVLCDRYDAAGDQPLRKVCLRHPDDGRGMPCAGRWPNCRVADAIVCPLPEQP